MKKKTYHRRTECEHVCWHCKKPFKNVRSDAKTCSPRCRQGYRRTLLGGKFDPTKINARVKKRTDTGKGSIRISFPIW